VDTEGALPIDSITLKDNLLRFEMNRLGASYSSMLNKNVSEVAGEWQQSGSSLALSFRRLGEKLDR
jgi:hypothetical protein